MFSDISLALNQLGIRKNSRSFERVVYAVALAIEDENRLTRVGKLYEEVGRLAGCSAFCVERSIRNVAQRAWTLNPNEISRMARCDMYWQPTASEFIDILADYAASTLAESGK